MKLHSLFVLGGVVGCFVYIFTYSGRELMLSENGVLVHYFFLLAILVVLQVIITTILVNNVKSKSELRLRVQAANIIKMKSKISELERAITRLKFKINR